MNATGDTKNDDDTAQLGVRAALVTSRSILGT